MKGKSMFSKIAVIGVAALSLAAGSLTVTAQTNTVTPPTTSGFFGDLGAVGAAVWADVTTLQVFTTNSDAMLQIGGGVNTSQANQGIVAVALTVPLSTTSNSLGSFSTAVGCFGAYSGAGVWEDGAASVQIGQEWTVPVLGNVYQFVEDGAAHNWKTGAYGNFAATGFEKTWTINENVDFGAGVLAANDSTRSGVDILGGFHLTAHF
jgi:hypothetical protein